MNADDFALFGNSPSVVIAPESNAEAQAAVRDLTGQAIAPWGGGACRHIGHRPARYDVALSTAKLNQITEYHPEDLVVTAQAGVTLAELQAALAVHGQFLPVDIAAPERQTVGGMVAARADSLRRFAFGSVRDSLIGVRVVNARGELIQGGGKVVKNVAGYDLPKLYCGSFGTLGLIVEASFKVAPLSAVCATVVLPLDSDRNSEDMLDALLASDLQPSFLYLLNPAASRAVLLSHVSDAAAQHLVIGFDGASEAVAWQLQALGGGSAPLDPEDARSVRARLRDFSQQPSSMTAAFHILSSQIGAFSRMVEWTARRAGFESQVAADAAVGMMRAHFEPSKEGADWHLFYHDLNDKAQRCGGSFIIERMPEPLRAAGVPVWSPLLGDFQLMRRVKERLDPERMWNPGRFIGGL